MTIEVVSHILLQMDIVFQLLRSNAGDYSQDLTRAVRTVLFVLAAFTACNVLGQEGETCAVPYVIQSLPYTDIGSTLDRANNYDEPCPFPYVSEHDVAYVYTPETNQQIIVSLCESSFDTKLYIYANGTPPAIACNDDYCGNAQGEPYRSYLECVPLSAGVPYCIVVDGYGSEAGDYQLVVTDCQQGETCETPYIISSLPFTVVASTAGRVNDTDETCPFGGITSPDVSYQYTPTHDELITVSLCESEYDTKVYIYANGVPPAIACNDDYCSNSQGDPFRSYLNCIPLRANVSYCIIVDGYTNEEGVYHLAISNCDFCIDTCFGTPENEHPCVSAIDTVNGGCDSDSAVFRPIVCGETICGTLAAGTEFGRRDSDWYQVALASRSILAWSAVADIAIRVMVVIPPCPGTFIEWEAAFHCDTVSATTTILEPGTYWLLIESDNHSYLPCLSYIATLTCTAMCDSAESLTIRYSNDALALRWNAPQAGDYQIWSALAAVEFPDAPWALETTVNAAAPGATSWVIPDGGTQTKKFYLVVHVCE